MKESSTSATAGRAVIAGLKKVAAFPIPSAARAALAAKGAKKGFMAGAARFGHGATTDLTLGSAGATLAPVALGVGQTYAMHKMTKNMHEDMRRRQADMEKQAFIPAPRAVRAWLAKASRTPGALPKGAPPTGPTLGLGPAGGANRSKMRRAAGFARGLTGPATLRTVGATAAPFALASLQGAAADKISNKTFLKSEEDRG